MLALKTVRSKIKGGGSIKRANRNKLNPHILEFYKIKNFKKFSKISHQIPSAAGSKFAGTMCGRGVQWGSGRIDHSPTIAFLWITILV